ncbi:TraX family protein [Bifidobacterium apri]|uniref:TraX family protein n=1 Tax=Bifidobacterium apri TaxID=1769423 RepID=UPI003994E2FD
MEDTVTGEYTEDQTARGGQNRRKGMTTFRVKTVGWLFVLLSAIGTTVLPSALGYRPGSDDMAAMTVLVICEVVSWTAVPLYSWLLVQGYRHTHSVVQYGLRLLALAVISEVPYDMATSGKVWDMNSQNPVFALVFALIVIAAIDWARENLQGISKWAVIVLVSIAGLAWSLLLHVGLRQGMFNMGVLLIGMVLVFYAMDAHENTMMMTAGVLGAVFFIMPAVGVAMLHTRRDELGYRHAWTKWVFYALYPVTLLLCALPVM